jgi:hypothetical protein
MPDGMSIGVWNPAVVTGLMQVNDRASGDSEDEGKPVEETRGDRTLAVCHSGLPTQCLEM